MRHWDGAPDRSESRQPIRRYRGDHTPGKRDGSQGLTEYGGLLLTGGGWIIIFKIDRESKENTLKITTFIDVFIRCTFCLVLIECKNNKVGARPAQYVVLRYVWGTKQTDVACENNQTTARPPGVRCTPYQCISVPKNSCLECSLSIIFAINQT